MRSNARFEILESHPSKMTARVIGSPELLVGCQFHKEHCQELPFGQEALGIGLGASAKISRTASPVLASFWRQPALRRICRRMAATSPIIFCPPVISCRGCKFFTASLATAIFQKSFTLKAGKIPCN